LRPSPKAMIWKTLDFGVQTNFSEPASFLVATGHEVDRLHGELKRMRKQNEEQHVAIREANIHGLFFGAILESAFQHAREHSGALAAMASLAGGYAGAGVDTIISWVLDNAGKVIEATEEWANIVYEWWLATPEGQGSSEDEWLFNPITGFGKNPFYNPDEHGVAGANGEVMSELVLTGEEYQATMEEGESVLEAQGWSDLNKAQAVTNEMRNTHVGEDYAGSKVNVAQGAKRLFNGLPMALARFYYMALDQSRGMQAVYAGEAHKNR